jgi:hypothetical protein
MIYRGVQKRINELENIIIKKIRDIDGKNKQKEILNSK